MEGDFYKKSVTIMETSRTCMLYKYKGVSCTATPSYRAKEVSIVNTEITKVINIIIVKFKYRTNRTKIHLHLLQVYIYHMMICVMYVGVSNLLSYEH